MFDQFFGYFSALYNKYISSDPIPRRKRRLPESHESIPSKMMKISSAFDEFNSTLDEFNPALDDFDILSERQTYCAMHRKPKQSKENCNQQQEDECAIIAEIPRSIPHYSGYGRRHERSQTCNYPPTRFSQQMAKAKADSSSNTVLHNYNEFKKSLKDNDVEVVNGKHGMMGKDDDVKVVHIKHGSDTKKGTSKEMGLKKIFTTKRFDNLSTSKVMKNKRGFEANLKEKLRKQNFRETYRLKERWQYEQLLKSQVGGKRLSLSFNKAQPVESKILAKSTVPYIDLTEEKSNVTINRSRESIPSTSSTKSKDSEDDLQIVEEIPKVRSFPDMLKFSPVKEALDDLWVHHSRSLTNGRELMKIHENDRTVDESKSLEKFIGTSEQSLDDTLEEQLMKYMRITGADEEESRCCLVQLSDKQLKKIQSALAAHPAEQILAQQFGLQVTRRDMQTLKGLNWLNDEVINFYMQLIMERSKKNTNLPKVYAFNTFFYPKLVTNGHASLKRWTKKVDIFLYDVILIPVHLGMHWCMSVIDFRAKEVRYYDSMGAPNDRCLKALLYYLEAESEDKKNKKYDTSSWEQINVEDIPQQMNGSDCGVFSCMFAEHISRGSRIDFTQDNMPYLRKKMVLEILEMKLLI